MGDTAKVYLGPAKVSFGKSDPAVFDLTKGVTLTFSQSTHPVTVDQYGEQPIKEIVTGQEFAVEVAIAESDFAKITKVIPGSIYEPADKKLSIRNAVGIDLLSIADQLTIEPNVEGAFDTITVLKAAPRPNVSRSFTTTGEQVYTVTFTAYPDGDGEIADFTNV
ncbi:hypothetical protein BEP19_14850 [Ammoniphilus oxalaticus]|uniref:Uncharacterized protein n=1 Tax=Ammoniphilus oxalaticus TaxID=66863 RepID=A0A419SCX0_9BACL|nr:hypothetical protein [Ammoniphilus oxalaticus]RKD20962.1 hypothetical protein BEP19_14850 [Ammoniphilus oxalaticus]